MLYLLGMGLGGFKLISLNVRGLSSFEKRKSILTWCRKQKVEIIFLQEIHSTIQKKNNGTLTGAAPLSLPMGAVMHGVLEYYFGMVLIAK